MSTFFTIVVLLGVGVTIYAWLIEPRLIEVRDQPALIPRLPTELSGTRILHMSDLHLKASHRGRARSLIRSAHQLRPDIIVITGDMIDSDENRDYVVRFLARLRCPEGIFAIFGNHDHYEYSFGDTWGGKKIGSKENDTAALREALAERDITVLANESVRLKIGGEPLWVIGIDEFAQGYDKSSELLNEAPMDDMLLLLAHKPEMVAKAPLRIPSLALVGHTHGGQIRIPGFGAIHPHTEVLDRKSNSGLVTIDNQPTHVSRGFGSSQWMPFRFFCRPEITLITLKRI